MEEFSTKIASWPRLDNGIHYKWLVDYAAFSAFGTFELSAEEWEKRDLIVNFKGNSELTTETDHQQAVGKAIDLVTDFIQKSVGETASSLTFACIPASLRKHTERRFKHFSEQVCARTGMENAYPASASHLQQMRMAMRWIPSTSTRHSSRERKYSSSTTSSHRVVV